MFFFLIRSRFLFNLSRRLSLALCGCSECNERSLQILGRKYGDVKRSGCRRRRHVSETKHLQSALEQSDSLQLGFTVDPHGAVSSSRG